MEDPPTRPGSNDTQKSGNEKAPGENPGAASLDHEAEQENEAGKVLPEINKNSISCVKAKEEDDADDEDDDDIDDNII